MIVDTNVSLGLWPFRRLPGDRPADLVARLKRRGVAQAWAGSFDGVFHRDLSSANARLAGACETAGRGFLLPFGAVNPNAPGWREDLRRCHEVHRMPGVRVHPNYHGYGLDHPAFAELLRDAAARGLIVQLVLTLEDERTQHPLLRVAPVDPAPLAALVSKLPGLRLLVLNRQRNPAGEALRGLAAAGQVCFDFAMTEGAGCVGELAAAVPAGRVVFGSHAPFQYFESALLKIRESGITGGQESAILAGNAKRLLAGAGG
jgi:predicted TIM-barrel fold metal-dependent hydrolase